MFNDRFSSYSAKDLAGQCRMQARYSLDPEYIAFMNACADRLSALSAFETQPPAPNPEKLET